MEDVHVEMLKDGKFYAITFRKPLAAGRSSLCKATCESQV
jgi:hypothetical protein